MNKILLLAAGVVLAAASGVAQPPRQTPDCGTIDRIRLYSPAMADTMTVDVWLPDGFDPSDASVRYPVVYMHDGQNLFDASTTWNRQSWEIDSVMCDLLSKGEVPAALVVGVHSSGDTRVGDLMPVRAVDGYGMDETLASVGMADRPARGDSYLSFMVETLKPAIDSIYPTMPDREHTIVAGSSMGGLISIYAICNHPDIFGTALCLSTHWIGTPEVSDDFSRAMERYIESNLPSPASHRLYFDRGTETIDAYYGDAESRILAMLRRNGYGDHSLKSLVEQGSAHEENAWKRRIGPALRFALSEL